MKKRNVLFKKVMIPSSRVIIPFVTVMVGQTNRVQMTRLVLPLLSLGRPFQWTRRTPMTVRVIWGGPILFLVSDSRQRIGPRTSRVPILSLLIKSILLLGH